MPKKTIQQCCQEAAECVGDLRWSLSSFSCCVLDKKLFLAGYSTEGRQKLIREYGALFSPEASNFGYWLFSRETKRWSYTEFMEWRKTALLLFGEMHRK